jgi:hypothetical protein
MRVVHNVLIERLSGRGEVRTGDDLFDSGFYVICPDEKAAQAWLDPERRRALEDLLTEQGFFAAEGGLAYSCGRSPGSVEELTRALDRLEQAAEALEAPGS